MLNNIHETEFNDGSASERNKGKHVTNEQFPFNICLFVSAQTVCAFGNSQHARSLALHDGKRHILARLALDARREQLARGDGAHARRLWERLRRRGSYVRASEKKGRRGEAEL
jgi:hypothetical protein